MIKILKSGQDRYKGQFSQLSPSKDAISLRLIIDMKECRVSQFFSSLESLDKKYGPLYLIKCFPYLKVRNLGILKSFSFRSWYVVPFSSVCRLVSFYV